MTPCALARTVGRCMAALSAATVVLAYKAMSPRVGH